MFISTFEKQLDAKRRIVAPVEYRTAVAPFDGLFCFPSIEADCIEGGGKALFDSYARLIDEYPFGDPARTALETSIMGGMAQLSFDTAGRVTLPESFCEMFGLTDWVTLVGLGDRFQIWPREVFRERTRLQRDAARTALLTRARNHAAAKASAPSRADVPAAQGAADA
ncbi:MAG TPA: division/cell wall cluster transcriptional repressor MraZ [Caulobacteraceae bacterium]|nr:division/cell wall cluster transcriptional repressor MraZ [Caulobacteraceae bacterium]